MTGKILTHLYKFWHVKMSSHKKALLSPFVLYSQSRPGASGNVRLFLDGPLTWLWMLQEQQREATRDSAAL